MQQWPYKDIAKALEVIPRTLIQNCGAQPIRVLTALRVNDNLKSSKISILSSNLTAFCDCGIYFQGHVVIFQLLPVIDAKMTPSSFYYLSLPVPQVSFFLVLFFPCFDPVCSRPFSVHLVLCLGCEFDVEIFQEICGIQMSLICQGRGGNFSFMWCIFVQKSQCGKTGWKHGLLKKFFNMRSHQTHSSI